MNIDYAPGTVKNYFATLKHLKAFVLKHYKNTDILLKELNYGAELSTKEYVEADKWNNEKGRVKGNSESVRSIPLFIARFTTFLIFGYALTNHF